MEAGIELCEWFKAETTRVYSILEETPEAREMRQLVEWIEGKGDRLTARELARGPRRYRIDPDRAEADLQQLVDGGLGTWADLPPTEQGGRPTRVFCLKNLRAGDETPVKPEEEQGFVATPQIPDATEEGEWEG